MTMYLLTPEQHKQIVEALSMLNGIGISRGIYSGEAALTLLQSMEPVEPCVWGMPHGDGSIYDVIQPVEHTRVEGSYTIPLYAAKEPT